MPTTDTRSLEAAFAPVRPRWPPSPAGARGDAARPHAEEDLLVSGGGPRRPGPRANWSRRATSCCGVGDDLASCVHLPLRVGGRRLVGRFRGVLASRAGLTRWWTSSSIMMTGARPQAPKQRPTSSENRRSEVVSPTSIPKARLQRRQHFLAAANVAGRPQADPHQVLAARHRGKERIETHHAGHFAIGLVQAPG